jgi:hypothetical protein
MLNYSKYAIIYLLHFLFPFAICYFCFNKHRDERLHYKLLQLLFGQKV